MLDGCHHAHANLVQPAGTLLGAAAVDAAGLAEAAAADDAGLLPEKLELGGPHSGGQSGRWRCAVRTWLLPRYVAYAACAIESPTVEHSSAEVAAEVPPPVDEGWNPQPTALTVWAALH